MQFSDLICDVALVSSLLILLFLHSFVSRTRSGATNLIDENMVFVNVI